MPSAKIRLHPAAEQEVEAAFDWYLERNPAAARAFLTELQQAIERVAEAPDRWPKYLSDIRRYVFSRYPFQLIYRKRGSDIEIMAVAHGRRRPGYWASRD